MKYFKSYLYLSIKRFFKKYAAIFITTVLLIAVLFLTARMLLNINKNDVSNQRVKIGIVGDMSDTYLGMGLEMLQNMDDINVSVEFEEYTEAKAREELAFQRISGYLKIPDNYVSDILSGKEAKLDFYMLKTSAAAPSLMIGEVIKVISPIVTGSESYIYAMRDYAKSEDFSRREVKQLTNNLNIKYIDNFLERGKTYNTNMLGIGSLSLTEYYICGIITFFMLIFAISCCMLFSDRNIPLCKLLSSVNFKPKYMILCEYISYVLIMWVTMIVLCTISSFAIDKYMPGAVDTSWLISLSIKLLPYILMVSSMQFLIYELSGGIISAVLSQFVIAAALAYISGCFYPYYFFPEIVQSISSILPSGILFGYLRRGIVGIGFEHWYFAYIYTFIFFALSVIVRKRRLQRDSI